jgi:hypothetical protein
MRGPAPADVVVPRLVTALSLALAAGLTVLGLALYL